MPATKKEVTGERSLNFSKFHRNRLASWCYCTDLDFIEVRSKGTADGAIEIVAFLEVKGPTSNLTKFQQKVFAELSRLANVPCYLVRHNEDLSTFYVREISYTPCTTQTMNQDEFIEWIEAL